MFDVCKKIPAPPAPCFKLDTEYKFENVILFAVICTYLICSTVTLAQTDWQRFKGCILKVSYQSNISESSCLIKNYKNIETISALQWKKKEQVKERKEMNNNVNI